MVVPVIDYYRFDMLFLDENICSVILVTPNASRRQCVVMAKCKSLIFDDITRPCRLKTPSTPLLPKSLFRVTPSSTLLSHCDERIPIMMTSSNGNIFRVTGPLSGEFTGPGEFPTQRPVTRSFDVFFDLRLNKRLSKQPRGWWFETQSWSLWRHCNVALTPPYDATNAS